MNLREMTRRILRPDPRPAAGAGSAAQSLLAAPTPTDEESLGRELLNLDWGLGLFRWAHLANALDLTPGAKNVLSIGSGGGLHEAFLARTRPALNVTGADQREPSVAQDLPNLRFLRGDLLDPEFRKTLPQADFIYSIECLEHIEDDVTVAGAMADLLAPGGRLYLQLPFASTAEQADPGLRETERRNHGHVRPGYDADGLRRLVESFGLEVELVACAFWFPLQPMLWASLEKFGPLLTPNWREILALVSGDVREGVAPDRTRATAIKVLARKPL
jgi:SAM-dependent methyltransferase